MESSKAGKSFGRFLRRKIIVDPAMQWKCALSLAMIVFLCTSVIGFGVFGQLHEQARLRASDLGQTSGSVTFMLLTFSLGTAAITAGGVGFWSLLMTRRVCGPAFVMERYLKELKAGRIPETRSLRKNDELKQLHQTLRETFDALRVRANADLALVCDMLESIRLTTASDDTGRRKSLAAMAPKLELLRTELVMFLQANRTDAAPNADQLAAPQAIAQGAA